MIIVPFDLSKRKQVKEQLCKSNKYQKLKKVNDKEKPVKIMHEKLRSIITLSYHLLRVFLIKRSHFEEPNSIAQENQRYVLTVAGETGMTLFIQHIACDIGATDVLIKLLNHENQNVSLVETLMERAEIETQIIVNTIHAQIKVDEDRQKVSCFRLLSALCHDMSTSRQIAEKLFNPASHDCLIQTRVSAGNHVEIKLRNDETWHNINTVIEIPSCLLFMNYVLKLIYAFSDHPTTVDITSQCVGRQVCFYSIKNTKVSSTIRSRFCDILRGIFFSKYNKKYNNNLYKLAVHVNISDYKAVALDDFTIDLSEMTTTDIFYPMGSHEIYCDFFKKVMRWTLQFLEARNHEVKINTVVHEYISNILL